MHNHHAVVEWQNDGDTHWFTSGVVKLNLDPETLAAIREVVPTAQGFPASGLSAAAAAEQDNAIRSTVTLMSIDEVRTAHDGYERKHGQQSNELRLVLRLMDEYIKRGVSSRFIFWEVISGP